MNEVIDILKSKQFLIGLGVGYAGYLAYNHYMKKEATSSASGSYCTCPSSKGGVTKFYTSSICPCPADPYKNLVR
jgi:hypothetical protein